MNADSSQLLWDALLHKEGEIPWPVLRAFAEAVVDDADVVQGLFDVYTQAYEAALTETCYADLYVPAIFALAAPRLEGQRQAEISTFLATRLAEAGREDDDLMMEVLTAAAGTIGPAVVPAVLEAIAGEPDSDGAWVFLWSLTILAAQSNDERLRQRVIRACVEILERADRDEVDLWDGMNCAWTLAILQCTEYSDLLRRLSEKARGGFLLGDYRAAYELLQKDGNSTPAKELWDRPVDEWLPRRWETCRQWFADRETEPTSPDTLDEDEYVPSHHPLTVRFMNSPVASSLPGAVLGYAPHVVDRLLSYSFEALDLEPEEWDEPALRALLLEEFPRRALGTEKLFRTVVPVTEAFLFWMSLEGRAAQAKALAGTIHGWSDEIVSRSLDAQRWGPAKEIGMPLLEAEGDRIDLEMLEEVIEEQTHGFFEAAEQEIERDPTPDDPPIPIVERSAKIGRNAPCPCGSGRKYKKCCGRPAAKDTAST